MQQLPNIPPTNNNPTHTNQSKINQIKCLTCDKMIKQNDIYQHLQKHKKKKRKSKPVNTQFWGWKHNGAAPKNYGKYQKKYVNKNDQQSHQKQDKDKLQAKPRKKKTIIKCLSNDNIVKQQQCAIFGNYQLRQRKVINQNVIDQSNQINQQIQQNQHQQYSQQHQQQQQINPQAINSNYNTISDRQSNNNIRIQNNIEEYIEQYRYKLLRQKQKTAVVQNQLIDMRNKLRQAQKKIKDKDQEIHKLKEILSQAYNTQNEGSFILKQEQNQRLKEEYNHENNTCHYNPFSINPDNNQNQPTFTTYNQLHGIQMHYPRQAISCLHENLTRKQNQNIQQNSNKQSPSSSIKNQNQIIQKQYINNEKQENTIKQQQD